MRRIKARPKKPCQVKKWTSSWDDMMRLKKSCELKNGAMATRSWDDMNYDILLNIMRRLSWSERLMIVCMVSKTWLSAVLDSMSPPNVIDLRLLDSPNLKRMCSRFTVFLKRRLDNMPADSCTAFFQGLTLMKAHKYRYIGNRTPSMQKLIIPRAVGMSFDFIEPAMKYWKKLKVLQCPAILIRKFRNNFTGVKSLQLFGPVDDAIAAIIRDKCPQLKRLRLPDCALSVNALSTILDGHKNLELLDTRHSYRVPDRKCKDAFGYSGAQPLEWNEEEIRHKAANVKVHLKCDRERCSKCALPYRNMFPIGKLGKLDYGHC